MLLIILITIIITLFLFLFMPVKVSLKAEKEGFLHVALLSISYLNIFSVAFSPKGQGGLR